MHWWTTWARGHERSLLSARLAAQPDRRAEFLLPGTLGGRSPDGVIREAKTLSSLNHPNIVTVYEVIQSPSGLAIVMELVEGASLRSLCGGSLPEDRVARLGLQIAQALAAAHAHGIVHRDIKPENILVRPDGYVKVVDFGLARHFAADDKNPAYGLTAGTLRYMSPEQVRGRPISPASDVFSLGLVLYELAAGEHPFAGESSMQTAYSIATKPFAILFNTPVTQANIGRLEKLIAVMLAKDPAERPSAAGVAEELDQILHSAGRAVPGRISASNRGWWAAGLAACFLGVALFVWLAYSRRDTPVLSDLKIRPLTAQAGWEDPPALSPDGQPIAFTWADKLDGVRNIYLKQLSEDNPVKLTNDFKGLIGSLAWSPDGKRIAFRYSDLAYGKPAGSLYSVSVSDGRQQKLFDLVNNDLSSSIDWSPDGTELALSEAPPGTGRLALYLANLKTGKMRLLTSPPKEDWGDWSPKFSPDGSTIAFKRVTSFWVDDLYVVAEKGGTPRRLTAAKRGIWGHAWSPNGKSLIVSCQRDGSIFGIWRFPVLADAQPERISLEGIDAILPTTSRKTDSIAWVNQLWDLNIYRTAADGSCPFNCFHAPRSGRGLCVQWPIAFVSDRSGSREIWLAQPDGSGQVRVTNLKGPPIDQLNWSPDGRQLAFVTSPARHSGTFVLSCPPGATSCGEPQRLTTDHSSTGAASWSTDGKSLYFASERTGRWELWKQPASGGEPTQVTRDGGYVSRESPDGRWLYFSSRNREAIFRMPVSGVSPAELVVGSPYRVQATGWALTRSELFFIDRAVRGYPAVIRAYNPSTKAMRSIIAVDEIFPDRDDIGLCVSPDEKWILYSQLDRSGSNVMLAESR